MIVAAHGNVDEYCENHDMTVVERYGGKVEDYSGGCAVLVTDNCSDVNEYYYLKYKMAKRKIELVSTHWGEGNREDFVAYLNQHEAEERKRLYAGRLPFGFRRVDGQVVADREAMAVARRIIALRDAGKTYRDISEDSLVRFPDGRRMSISTIQVILRNRGKYE